MDTNPERTLHPPLSHFTLHPSNFTLLYISDPRALQRLLGRCELALEAYGEPRLQARLIEIAKLLMLDHRFGAGTTAWHIGGRSDLAGELVVA